MPFLFLQLFYDEYAALYPDALAVQVKEDCAVFRTGRDVYFPFVNFNDFAGA